MTIFPTNGARPTSLLLAVRLPARVNTEGAAEILGFQPHDIPVLTKKGLLKPLGGGPKNCVKFFSTVELEQLREDRKWLDKATAAVCRRKASSTNVTSMGQPASG